ncbi:Actin-related protein 10 [Paramyrothecium foliicola]|nr:Actin-related protein 10 [Paramyrothecium foliicola]
MSGPGATLAHRSVASIRGGATPGQPGASTPGPHTPPRAGSISTFGSPSTVRADDDILILEIGSRFVRIGFAGDSTPKATLSCGPEEQRRVGDFRAWQQPRRGGGSAWSTEHEIWRFDLRQLDLGLIEDKLDRMEKSLKLLRYLLVDSRPRRIGLVLDSAVPMPLLSVVFDTLFLKFQTPLISLMSTAVTTSVAAGVRSAVVIDMGWAETVITTVYEYREVKTTRTVRGGRLLLDELYQALQAHLGSAADDNSPDRIISFEECEDIMCRLAWCRPATFKSSQRQSTQLETVEEQDESETEAAQASPSDRTVKVPLRTSHRFSTIELPLGEIANVCEDTFFDTAASPTTFDDHELPAHLLLYQHLLQLPMDVRAVCMARIIFTGGCSNILGIKERIMDEVASIVERRGWEPVTGKGADEVRRKAKSLNKESPRSDAETQSGPSAGETGSTEELGAAYAEPQQDAIDAKLARHRKRPPQLKGQLRAIHSLGPWTGGSLLSQLKVPTMATIDRELWLQHGAGGAARPSDVDVKLQRQSMGAGGFIRGSGGQHANWTLGAWGAI